MLIDEAKIFVKAGDGGKGCVSFARTRFNRIGVPDGGDGGDGGSVILRATSSKRSFIDFKKRSHFFAEKGKNGGSNRKSGARGRNRIIDVPLGTLVKTESGEVLADLIVEGQQCVVAVGGRGGRGNASFVSQENRFPKLAEHGQKGEERWLLLELRLLADVGMVGLPNSGKSTLLNRLTGAHSKVADYPFTTLEPYLGVASAGEVKFVLADIPGIIEGASCGKGLGLKFLRHIARTKLLLFVLDAAGEVPPANALELLISELACYDQKLADKRKIVALNKVDLLPDGNVVSVMAEEIGIKFGLKVIPISALKGWGLNELVLEISQGLAAEEAGEPVGLQGADMGDQSRD